MRPLVLGTAGHIDHGKSALVEALTGVHPDRLREEQQRGITIDLGFAHFTSGDAVVAIVDVPGHERFVRNMLAGAGGIDAVMLVVAADESVMPQTREHFDICRLLGIRHGVVVLTKRDLVDVGTLEVVEAEVRDAVAGTFLEGAPVVPVSTRTGEGIDVLREVLAGLAGVAPRQARPGLTRLPVDRVFTVKGFGTVVTGTLVSGRIVEDERLEVLPEGREVRVRGVQVHGEAVPAVEAPRRVALNLGAVNPGDLGRGVTLATSGSLPVTRRTDVRLELLSSARPLLHGSRVRVHHGTSEVLARVAIAALQGQEGKWAWAEPGRAGVTVPSGARAYVRLRFDRPAVVTRGDRLVLRSYSPATTVGGATVLDPQPPPGRLRRPAMLERYSQLEATSSAIGMWLQEAGLRGCSLAALMRRSGLSAADLGLEVEAALAAGKAQRVGEDIFDASAVAGMEAALLQVLEELHVERPREEGFSRESLRQRVAGGAPPGCFAAVVARLSEAGQLAGTDRLRLASHLTDADGGWSESAGRVLRGVARAGLSPPDEGALAEGAALERRECGDLVHRLVREGRLVRLGGLVFHPEALARLKDDMYALGAGTVVDVAFVKQKYGLSRKYAIPLLEWLDRERVTRRTGTARVVLAR
jgi:selenocysteine-specific elongation factor